MFFNYRQLLHADPMQLAGLGAFTLSAEKNYPLRMAETIVGAPGSPAPHLEIAVFERSAFCAPRGTSIYLASDV